MTTKTNRHRHVSSPRWQHWQSTPVAEKHLTPEARAEGYTVVRVPPQAREVFLDLVFLLVAYARVGRRRPSSPEALAAWDAWHTYTRRLRAYLDRVSVDLPATVPPVPQDVPHDC